MEVDALKKLLTKIDSIDFEYADRISDEMFQYQPFFLSVMLGYKYDVTPEELDEIMKIYFIIWEFFKDNKRVQTRKVTEADFEKVQIRHIEMLEYTEGETDQKVISDIYIDDIDRMSSKPLLAAVFSRLKTRPVLMEMDENSKPIIFIEIKSFIECFENL